MSNAVAVTASATPNAINTGHNAQLTSSAQVLGSGYTVGVLPFGDRDLSALTNQGAIGDEGNATASLSFPFNFFGTNYTDVTIHSNGQILMGPGRTDANSIYSPPSTAVSYTHLT